MNWTAVTAEAGRVEGVLERVRVYIELTKPRIAVLVLMTVLVGGLLASWGQPSPWVLLWTVIGTALVAGSASVWNQWLERDRDARMMRTRRRPIPSGRITAQESVYVSLVMLVVGLGLLAGLANYSAAVWGLLTWALYIGVYTPLKPLTSWNTAVGAIAGALPVVIGWVASGGELTWQMWALFGIVFCWQFPHFMAIAWLYREDYARGGYRMMTVVDPSGRAAGVQGVVGALFALPASLMVMLPLVDFMSAPAAVICVTGVFLAGLGQLWLALLFLWKRDERSARWLLRASLIYLPLVLGLIACGPAF